MDNPNAFPINTHKSYMPGMSLRDYFAAKAMQAQISNPDFSPTLYNDLYYEDKKGRFVFIDGHYQAPYSGTFYEKKFSFDYDLAYARSAYEYADAMLKARQSTNKTSNDEST